LMERLFKRGYAVGDSIELHLNPQTQLRRLGHPNFL
jgi:hypothetical protein